MSGAPEAEYQLVIEALRRALNSMEQVPSVFEPLGEEALRYVLLTALNTRFGDTTSAEALRGDGKTDLLVRTTERVVYVGECKIWAGPKGLLEALDQLLGYGTRHDFGLGLILFVRSARFTRGAQRAREALAEHEQFRGWVGDDDAAGDRVSSDVMRMRVAQRADPELESTVTVQFAHLPSDRATQIDGELNDLEAGFEALEKLRNSVRSGKDDGVDYRASMSAADTSPPREPDSMMRFERQTPHGRMAFDAVPEDDEARQRYGPTGAILPTDGARGERIRMLIDDALQSGAEIHAAGGFKIRMDQYPPGMHSFVERLERQDNLRIVIQPSTAGGWPINVNVSTDRGEARATMPFWRVEPADGFDASLTGSFKNLSLTLSVTKPDPDVGQRQEFSWTLHATDAPTREKLAALDFLYAMSGTGELQLLSQDPNLPSITIPLSDNELDEDLRLDRAVMADLVRVEDWLGRPIVMPEVASMDQIRQLATIAEAIRTGT